MCEISFSFSFFFIFVFFRKKIKLFPQKNLVLAWKNFNIQAYFKKKKSVSFESYVTISIAYILTLSQSNLGKLLTLREGHNSLQRTDTRFLLQSNKQDKTVK